MTAEKAVIFLIQFNQRVRQIAFRYCAELAVYCAVYIKQKLLNYCSVKTVEGRTQCIRCSVAVPINNLCSRKDNSAPNSGSKVC